MLLVINIGNTNIRFGIFKEKECLKSWVVNTKPFKSKDELMVLFTAMYKQYAIEIHNITDIAIGSVVPQQTSIVQQALESLHTVKAKIVDRTTVSEVKSTSSQIGTDLYANAVAAHYLYPTQSKIIIDFGTALTLLGINSNGKILGVIIAPGIITSLNALVNNTAQLPDIEFKKPKAVLGNNTESCMQSGIIYGYTSMIEGLIEKINQEVEEETYVIATGGMSPIYGPLIEKINTTDQLHTLKGLACLYKL